MGSSSRCATIPPTGPEFRTGNSLSTARPNLVAITASRDNLPLHAPCQSLHTPGIHEPTTLPPPCTFVQEGGNTLGIAQFHACQGRSYSSPIKLILEISVHAVHCNGLHPCLESRDQTIIWMMTCAPLIFPEDLKLLLKEGMAKLCPIGIVPREYEALQLCLSPGEPTTPGHYLLVGMSTLSGAHMRLRDVLLL